MEKATLGGQQNIMSRSRIWIENKLDMCIGVRKLKSYT